MPDIFLLCLFFSVWVIVGFFTVPCLSYLRITVPAEGHLYLLSKCYIWPSVYSSVADSEKLLALNPFYLLILCLLIHTIISRGVICPWICICPQLRG